MEKVVECNIGHRGFETRGEDTRASRNARGLVGTRYMDAHNGAYCMSTLSAVLVERSLQSMNAVDCES